MPFRLTCLVHEHEPYGHSKSSGNTTTIAHFIIQRRWVLLCKFWSTCILIRRRNRIFLLRCRCVENARRPAECWKDIYHSRWLSKQYFVASRCFFLCVGIHGCIAYNRKHRKKSRPVVNRGVFWSMNGEIQRMKIGKWYEAGFWGDFILIGGGRYIVLTVDLLAYGLTELIIQIIVLYLQ